MDRNRTPWRLAPLGLAVAGAAWIVGCAAPPPSAPPPPPPAPAPAPPPAPEPAASAPAPTPAEPVPAGPAQVQQAQRQALSAAEMLELGNEEQALAEVQRALQSDPGNRLAQSLLKQIQTEPVTLLGREHFMYRVEPGESLSRIAGRFLKDVHLFYALARYNDIKVPRQLQGGQTIKVPGRAPAAAPPPPSAPPAPPAPAPAPTPAPAPKPAEPQPTAEAVVAQEYRRGLALMAQQKPAEAIQSFDRVLERDPNHANAKLKRAQALTQVGGLIRLLENNIRRLDGQIAQNPPNAAALKAERDKAAAERDRLQKIR